MTANSGFDQPKQSHQSGENRGGNGRLLVALMPIKTAPDSCVNNCRSLTQHLDERRG